MIVLDALFETDNAQGQLIKRYEQLILQPHPDHVLLETTLTQIEETHARDYEVKVKTIISKLQLTAYLDHSIGMLSGGEAKRVALARVLVNEPDFLLLDEPTNHLDLEMIERLERYLRDSKLTILMVTHDRYFLDRICTDIFELDRGNLHTYTGNYETFLTQKTERAEHEQKAMHEMKQLLKKELERMRKAPRARGTKSVGRVKKVTAMHEMYQQHKTVLHHETIPLTISVDRKRLGNKIMKLHNLEKAFEDKQIITQFSYEFRKGERVGIIGKNGVGKSTFVQMLMGIQQPDSGSIKLGDTVQIGYYQQEEMCLEHDKKVIDVVKDIAEYITIANGKRLSATQLLERFLFPPKQQHARAYTLSGGEKRRLHLLTVLIKNPNFLILDEPTNDLDLLSITILEEFLLHYQGCLIVISHDRFFMDRIVDHLFVFEGDGKVSDFRGTYSDYKANKSVLLQTARQDATETQTGDTSSQNKGNNKLSYNERREFVALETEIDQLETRKEEINMRFQE